MKNSHLLFLLVVLLPYDLFLQVLPHPFLALPALPVLFIFLNVVRVQGAHAVAMVVLLSPEELVEPIHGVIGSLDAYLLESFHQQDPYVLSFLGQLGKEVLR